MNISELRELLRTDVATVVFSKKDGSSRTMICTTMKEYLPEAPSVPSVVSPTVVTVWDLEQNGWRSFRFDSVKSIQTDYFNYVVES
jgi:hypothetical protein